MSSDKIILDCDPGMDDSMAIVLAVKSDNLDVQAVTTTHGNYPADVTAENALKVLEMLNRTDIPVAKGADSPLVRPSPPDPFSHGDDGQANNRLPNPTTPLDPRNAAQMIVDVVNENPNEITIVSTAPMTNLALALKLDASLADKIKRIVAISGSFGVNDCAFTQATGDNPMSEWNVYVDPEAAKAIYESGIPLLAIGLDIATFFDVDFTDEDVKAFHESDQPEAKFLARAIDFTRGRGYGAYTTVIDCMAVAAVIDPTLITSQEGLVGIATEGDLTRGMTIWDRRKHHAWEDLPRIQIADSADYQKFLSMLRDALLKGETK